MDVHSKKYSVSVTVKLNWAQRFHFQEQNQSWRAIYDCFAAWTVFICHHSISSFL